MSSEISDALLSLKSSAGSLAECFRPGLSIEELNRLETKLLPFQLANEVRALYQCHNGAEEPFGMTPAFSFMTFDEAIREYEFQLELEGGTEGWNPLWFPLFSFEGDSYCVTLSFDRKASCPIYLSYNEDTELYLILPDLVTFIRACAECFRTNAFNFDGEYLESDSEKELKVMKQFGSPFPHDLVDGRTEYSKAFTQKWPEEWRRAIGRTPEDYLVKGADKSIFEFLRDSKKSVVHAAVAAYTGTGNESIVKIEDITGALTAFCHRSAVGSRELQIGRNYEMVLNSCELFPSQFTKEMDLQCDASIQSLILLG